jgi:hypothetical protein
MSFAAMLNAGKVVPQPDKLARYGVAINALLCLFMGKASSLICCEQSKPA